AVENHEGFTECSFYLFGRAYYDGRIGSSPMRGHRLAGPDGTHLFSRVVANGEDKVHLGRSRLCKLFPVLAAQAIRGQMRQLNLLERLWTNAPRGLASRAIGNKVGAALMIENRFGHDGASRIPCAQEENIVVCLHGGHALGLK